LFSLLFKSKEAFMPGGLSALLTHKKPQSANIVEERVLNFLRHIPPFQNLSEPTLSDLVTQTEIHYFPADSRILSQNQPASNYLYIIERGGVKKLLQTGADEEILIEVAGEGELFGVLSSLKREAPRFEVIAIADTLCYAIPHTAIQPLLKTQPGFADYLLDFSIHHYLDRSLNHLRQRNLTEENNQQFLFNAPIQDLAHSPLVTCPETATVQEAARLMTGRQASSVIVTDAAGRLIGIVTDRDLRERVVAAGGAISEPVRTIMSAPLYTIAGDEPVAEALRQMIRHQIHHLVVTQADRPIGMLTSHDLVLLQSSSLLSLVQEIEQQSDLTGLRRLHDRGQQSILPLLRQGLYAGQLGRMMADLNDRLASRVIQLTENALGPPPVPYCWFVMGSEGRREQTIKTDQDNALIYADPAPELAGESRTYFLELGRRIAGALVEVGFPPCPGQFMVSNPEWVQSFQGWQNHFQRWVNQWDLAEIAEVLLFFDLRGVYGDRVLIDQLQHFITNLLSQHPRFLSRLAHLSIRHTPPLGFFGQFIFDHDGQHQHELDIKHRGIMPVVDLVRFFALQHSLTETNTFDRLEQLKIGGYLPPSLAGELAQTYEFLLHLRIQHEWEQLQTGQPSSTYLDPRHLSILNRRLLKESFKIITRAQAHLRQATHHKVGRLL
jgi:CBS domain-containing protein